MYRFNGGKGAVTCDHCQVVIDEGLSHDEYLEDYASLQKKDYCMKCFKPENRKKTVENLGYEEGYDGSKRKLSVQ